MSETARGEIDRIDFSRLSAGDSVYISSADELWRLDITERDPGGSRTYAKFHVSGFATRNDDGTWNGLWDEVLVGPVELSGSYNVSYDGDLINIPDEDAMDSALEEPGMFQVGKHALISFIYEGEQRRLLTESPLEDIGVSYVQDYAI